MQGRTHNCGQLRLENAGEKVTLVGWFENIRKVSKNLGFVILRDFYGTTQIVVETEDLMEQFSAINTESTIEVTGTVRERSSKNPKLATGDVEVVPETVKVLGKCQYQELPFQPGNAELRPRVVYTIGTPAGSIIDSAKKQAAVAEEERNNGGR